MAVGLETRAPFLDPKIVQLALRINKNLKIKNSIPKNNSKMDFEKDSL